MCCGGEKVILLSIVDADGDLCEHTCDSRRTEGEGEGSAGRRLGGLTGDYSLFHSSWNIVKKAVTNCYALD